jgi:hypothetical protein
MTGVTLEPSGLADEVRDDLLGAVNLVLADAPRR